MTQKIKQIVISVIIIVVAFIGIKSFFATDELGDKALAVDQLNKQKFIDGQAILTLLNRLNKVTLDEEIFSSTVFESLVSFERVIPDQPVARPNPFAPIGTDSNAR